MQMRSGFGRIMTHGSCVLVVGVLAITTWVVASDVHCPKTPRDVGAYGGS